MIKLLRLYSKPEIFKPIQFDNGINIILGEKVSSAKNASRKDKKTNGVGKSISIECINFCLFKSSSESRIMRIPNDVLPPDTQIMLDLIINEVNLTIVRTKFEPEKPSIFKDGKENKFLSLSDATEHLNHLLYAGNDEVEERPSFRELIGPIIRDEDSEFKEIIRCYDVNKNVPLQNLIKPHLYFFGIDISLVEKLQKKLEELSSLQILIRSLDKNLTNDSKRDISQVKAEINSLGDELQRLDKALNSFETNEVYESHQNQLAEIESDLDKLRARQAAHRFEIKKIESLPKIQAIPKKEIEILYNQFKKGLGDSISKSLDEVLGFKIKLDEFQSKLINQKSQALKQELEKTTQEVRGLEAQRISLINLVDQKGVLKDLKVSCLVYEEKNRAFQAMQSQLEQYENSEREYSRLIHLRDELFLKLDAATLAIKEVIASFNQTILDIHDLIMGNRKASFDIEVFTKKKLKQIAQLVMRIDDDGSRSVDREKVFIYDMALMFNEHTRKRHPKLLIHDNIFDVDQDTLVQSLNYLAEQEKMFTDFQYILTLNRDKIEHEEREQLIKLDIAAHEKASFNKEKPFLKMHYQEIISQNR